MRRLMVRWWFGAILFVMSLASGQAEVTGVRSPAPGALHHRAFSQLAARKKGLALSRVTVLRPAPGNEVIESHTLLQWSDGSRTLVTKSEPKAPRRLTSDTDIDLQRGTYKTMIRPPADGAGSDSPEGASERFRTGSDSTFNRMKFWYEAKNETWEPIKLLTALLNYLGLNPGIPDYEPVTRTISRIQYTACPGGTIKLNETIPVCQPYVETFIGTHWFQDLCLPIRQSNAFYGELYVSGNYHNDDFPGILALVQLPLGVANPFQFFPTTTTGVFDTVDVWTDSDGIVGQVYTHDVTGPYGVLLSQHRSEDFGALPGGDCGFLALPFPPAGGGGSGSEPPPDSPDGPSGGPTVCVSVHDGLSGEYLGDCCGGSVEEIIDCATNML
jgi:hypothetical protein